MESNRFDDDLSASLKIDYPPCFRLAGGSDAYRSLGKRLSE